VPKKSVKKTNSKEEDNYSEDDEDFKDAESSDKRKVKQ
jgi:hypothetical protein